LGIGDWAQSPIPNPQSPSPIPNKYLILEKNIKKIVMENNTFIEKYLKLVLHSKKCCEVSILILLIFKNYYNRKNLL
jgi:hypothetical protein